jgi:hypothetical protein
VPATPADADFVPIHRPSFGITDRALTPGKTLQRQVHA